MAVCILTLSLLLLLPGGRTAWAGDAAFSLVDEGQGRFRVEARQAPLLKVLAALAGHTEAELFIAPSIENDPVDISLPAQPVDKILTKVLRPYDFVASFGRTGEGGEHIRLVKVYQRGRRGENLARVNPMAKTAEVARKNLPAGGASQTTPQHSAPGTFLSGSRPEWRRQPAGEAPEERVVAVSRTMGISQDLAEFDLNQSQWKTLQAPTIPETEPTRQAMLAEGGAAQLDQAANRDALAAGLQRLEMLAGEGGSTFSVTLSD
ncbi:MAG: hypothetical protein AB1568_13840 [Thermodesulfobacteriota bacterium]